MPRVKYIPTPQAPAAPPRDELKELFKHYMKFRGLSSARMGALLGGMSDGAVRAKLCRGTDTWSGADIRQWCTLLEIPPAEVGRAMMRG